MGQPGYLQKLAQQKGCEGNGSVLICFPNEALEMGSAGEEDRADLPQPSGRPELWWGNGQHWAGQPLPGSICLAELPGACWNCRHPSGLVPC